MNEPAAHHKSRTDKRYRIYEQWQGKERFFCWGHCVAGPNWKSAFGSALLIVAPTVVFLYFVAPYVAREVHAVLLVISCILPSLSFLWLMMTACRDPGIIPRQEPDEEFQAQRKPRQKEVTVNNQQVTVRYNDTCHFFQPPRAHHCSVNDNCIERFDHHCPWVGTTIGLRNYRTFLLFIFTTSILCIYVFACCLTQLFLKHNQLVDDARRDGRITSGLWGKTLADVPAALALMAYTFLFFLFVGGLTGFHSYLVATNQTTYENFRYNNSDMPNPYDIGLFSNCAQVLCMRIPPSRINFRSYADELPSRHPASDMPLSYAITHPSVEGCCMAIPSLADHDGMEQHNQRPAGNTPPSLGHVHSAGQELELQEQQQQHPPHYQAVGNGHAMDRV